MQLDFSILERSLPWIESQFVQGLDGILHVRFHIPGLVDGSIGTNTKNLSQLKSAGKDLA
jgi:hypothetical protein